MKFVRAAFLYATVQASRTEGDHEDAVALQFSQGMHSARADTAALVAAVAMAPSQNEGLLQLESLAQSVVQDGVTIDDAIKSMLHDVKASLTGTSEKGIRDAHAADEQLRQNAQQTVQQCEDNFGEAGTDNAAIGVQVEGKGQSHQVCRKTLQTLIADQEEKCTTMSNYLAALNPPNCAVPGRDGMTHYISMLETYQFSMKTQWPVVEGACKAAEDARSAKRQECHTRQGLFEGSFCSYRQDMFASCAEYERCFGAADTELRRLLDIAESNAGSRQIEWVAIQKIKCYVDVLLSSDDNLARQGAMDTCHDLAPNVDELKLIPITPLTVQECDLSPVFDYPCTDPFQSARYSGLAEIAQCQPCPDLPANLMMGQAATTATAPKAPWVRLHQQSNTCPAGYNTASLEWCRAHATEFCKRGVTEAQAHSGWAHNPDGCFVYTIEAYTNTYEGCGVIFAGGSDSRDDHLLAGREKICMAS